MRFSKRNSNSDITNGEPLKLKQTQAGDIAELSEDRIDFFASNITEIPREISKLDLAELPLAGFSGQIIVVDDENSCWEACEILQRIDILGFDTETRPSFKKGEFHQIALLQLSSASTVYLFRLNKIGLPDCLRRILEQETILKVGIALENDIPELRYYGSISPASMVDLNRICGRLEFVSIGARKLAALFLGFRLSKAQQTSNWENETLSPSQQIYAATDAWVCREIYLRLNGLS
ncbi:MAG: 3'-5' exonuclease [Bacteroidales bacterium]|jgi:ribonuclease D|nr:3'-5' exonuclease [Bacteroidales bacterium]